MKVSLAWVFDHIDAPVHDIDITVLVNKFNQSVAEIESYNSVITDFSTLALAHVIAIKDRFITVIAPEWNNEYQLPYRADAKMGNYFFVYKKDSTVTWACMQHVGSQKETLLPALAENAQWKHTIERVDYIMDIDNKSITNRADLWGHRGIAREIAALCDLPFKSVEQLIGPQPLISAQKNPYTITIAASQGCSRFSGVFLPDVRMHPCDIKMAFRLARIDAKPINALVDVTNYVMADWGHPMHAFDADAIRTKKVIIRWAHGRENLTLLDEQTLELGSHDLVVADGDNALALAGIMGGVQSGVTLATKALFLEAACFDATTIRVTAMNHKKRTEASARFEKSLDPHQTELVLRRALQLYKELGCIDEIDYAITSVGTLTDNEPIKVTHALIEQRIGALIDSEMVIKILEKLGCGVTVEGLDGERMYTVTVPTFRAVKDIRIQEDVIEEVARFFGYMNIPRVLPAMERMAFDWHVPRTERTIKSILAYVLGLRELYSYAFFDESFLAKIKWQPLPTATVKHPVSSNWQRLVSSLMPHLLQAIEENSNTHDVLRFFESARVWNRQDTLVEQKVIAGIMFDKKHVINFYDAKAELMHLFEVLKVPVTWKKVHNTAPWYLAHQTAQLWYEEKPIGYAGIMDPLFLNQISHGSAFCFELDADFLFNYVPPITMYKTLSKYPDVVRDISILIPLAVTVDDLTDVLKKADDHIVDVSLIDFFQKEEWVDKKALTFRCIIRDYEKTLTTQEIDTMVNSMIQGLTKKGAVIR